MASAIGFKGGGLTIGQDPERTRLIALLEEKQDEESFQNAKRAIEAALAEGETARLLYEYGYIHQCRGWTAFRRAIKLYERSLELDSTSEKTHHQLISAYTGLRQTRDAIELYKKRLAADPENIAEYRFVAHAYLAAGEYQEAGKVIDAGLALEPNDQMLLESKGSVLEGQGRPEEALAIWQRAFELDPESSISARYSRVFLLQRLGRLQEAAAEWETIIEWLNQRDYVVEAEWPKRELEGVRRLIAKSTQS